MCANTERSPTGTSGLGSSSVSGRRRSPKPAHRTMAWDEGGGTLGRADTEANAARGSPRGASPVLKTRGTLGTVIGSASVRRLVLGVCFVWLAGSCGTDAVGVSECREIEYAR